MKTSRPRTGSSSLTDVSPSGNRSTSHAPGRTPSSRATARAKSGLAVPAKIVRASVIHLATSARRFRAPALKKESNLMGHDVERKFQLVPDAHKAVDGGG